MNNLAILGLTAGVGSLVLAGTATADLTGISWDELDSGLGIGTTYRIYADIDAGGEVDAVYGDGANPLTVGTSLGGGFYQNGFGGYSAPNAALFSFFPSLEFDSFVTIGLLTDTGNAMLDIGIDFTAFEAGGSIYTDNGTWFATPDDAQVHDTGTGRILIGQFTVGAADGVAGTINLQGKNADGSNWNAIGVDFDTLPAPGALALLGLAGIVARRRRK